MPVEKRVYDSEHDISQYVVSNDQSSLIVKIIDYGATITNILVNDNAGQQRDIVLGFDNLDGYLGKEVKNPYFGAAIGRVGNRIANGTFSLNDTTYSLPINNGPNSLHGGLRGFDKQKWSLLSSSENSVSFELVSEDGDQGYPGTLRAILTYTVTDNDELQLDYTAELAENQSDSTIVNLTNHTYFNLNGCTNEEEIQVLNHTVTMGATNYLEVNDALIPTGKLLSTKTDSPLMDFATGSGENAHTIGERITSIKPSGYDHCYAIDTNESNFNIKGNNSVREAVVVVRSPVSGITLTMSTTEPAFQFYTGNNLTDQLKTKSSQSATNTQLPLQRCAGFCLEAQRFPNAINIENWRKQVILAPGDNYTQKTIYKFNS